jgi:tetratricopeptide (TPR) repeat protein
MSRDWTHACCARLLLGLTAVLACALPATAQSTGTTGQADAERAGAESRLPFLRDIPAPVPGGCSADPAEPEINVSPENRQEAARLATEASNAAILGDLNSARDLLARAATLDPSDPNVAFRRARTLEALGAVREAVMEYCRYLDLDGDARDASEVTDLVRRIAPPVRPGIPDSAVVDFRAALDHADAGRLAEAEHAMTAAIGAAPGWPAAWYNRGVIRAQNRQRDPARADFRAFLNLEPGGAARETVVAWMAQLDATDARYSPGTAFAAGLIPGVGHFYTGRPGAGVLFLATAGGAAAAGLLLETKHVECLVDPQGGPCPPAQIRGERSERPYMMVGIGVAAAATIIGAIDAARGARSRNAREPIIRFGAVTAGAGASLLLPDVRTTDSRLDVELLRLRF